MNTSRPPVRPALVALAALVSLPGAVRSRADEPPAPATAPPPAAAAPDAEEDPADAALTERVERSIVQIFSSMRAPDLARPWTKQPPAEATGTGIVIEGKRILTNAHVVAYAGEVQVQAHGTGTKVGAKVVALGRGMDLAVLEVDDESLFEGREPLERSRDLPGIKDSILAYGYPTGGTNLSITKGIVSRIDFVDSRFDAPSLRIQVDAAINPGNSGGPAVSGGRLVGLVFSHLRNAQNIGYIIPTEEIELFLEDIADGSSDGKPRLPITAWNLENPALRASHGVPKETTGVLVDAPYGDDPAARLEKWDVLTHVGGEPVDNQGMVALPGMPRLSCLYMVQRATADGRVPVTVRRAGETKTFDLPTTRVVPLVMPTLAGDYPRWFIYGPVAFSAATNQFARTAMTSGELAAALASRGNPLLTRLFDGPAFPGEELVVVCAPLFPHPLSRGYGNPTGGVVATVNGSRVENLLHLVTLLRDAEEEFVTIEFAGEMTMPLVLPREAAEAAVEGILGDNGVRAQGSPDAMRVWQHD
ncbi:MAG: trypsin-like peptidase domain-containing protein [Planctomycetaceae bacterium]